MPDGETHNVRPVRPLASGLSSAELSVNAAWISSVDKQAKAGYLPDTPYGRSRRDVTYRASLPWCRPSDGVDAVLMGYTMYSLYWHDQYSIALSIVCSMHPVSQSLDAKRYAPPRPRSSFHLGSRT